MTDRDPLVPALTSLLVDVVWWLESCGDEEVDPDSVVKMMESVGGELLRLPSGQRERLLRRAPVDAAAVHQKLEIARATPVSARFMIRFTNFGLAAYG
ncbi:hypothetical protein OOK36_11290 [Streptomyces sp. NBC_00365]|uniref:hypothetical protein n=1 Tax=Streptomyces sp. NBC_00365 TaxID=2975726 RepID=UPI002258FDD2|nr:hypothetical protein [Streptomyces sp. NBC_00365]MCX5089463.1 hypothetical protein [Streptomyces sp. NBC_00365]